LAYRGIPLQSAYCGSKHATQGFTEAVRCELIHDNCHVKISMVQLPAVNTPQFIWVKNRLPNKPQPVPAKGGTGTSPSGPKTGPTPDGIDRPPQKAMTDAPVGGLFGIFGALIGNLR